LELGSQDWRAARVWHGCKEKMPVSGGIEAAGIARAEQDAEGRLQRLRNEVLATRLYQSRKSRKFVNADSELPPSYGKLFGSMARELVFLENSTFAAWGCRACSWIIPNAAPELSDKPPAAVKQAFNRHECAKFPRLSHKGQEDLE
jgi:hypothetical protein